MFKIYTSDLESSPWHIVVPNVYGMVLGKHGKALIFSEPIRTNSGMQLLAVGQSTTYSSVELHTEHRLASLPDLMCDHRASLGCFHDLM